MTFTHALGTNNYGPAKFIVSTSAANGTHTTIGDALTSASSGDTIVVRDGTYTENLTYKAGVNVVAYNGGGDTPTVTIIGKGTLSSAGTVTISNIRLQTNSDFFLVVSGSVASVVNLENCYLNCSNNTGISFTSSSASSGITIKDCIGNIGTTGITLFSHSASGSISMFYSIITNGGSSSTASTCSAGSIGLYYTYIAFPVTTSGTSGFVFIDCVIDSSTTNSTSLTLGGSGVAGVTNCYIASGTASAVSIGNTTSFSGNTVSSTNTNAITGAGTIQNLGTFFGNTSYKINTTTQTLRYFGGAEFLGRNTNTAPSAGMIGEQIRSAIATGSAVTISNGNPANVTSISLTAGIWDVSTVCAFTGITTGTALFSCINTTSASFGGIAVAGDNYVTLAITSLTGTDDMLCIPSYRMTLASTTTVYLCGQSNFTAGTGKIYGRISATRVA